MLKNLGDKIAAVAQPIAKTIDYWIGSNIQNCGGCHQMQHNLNAGMSLSDAIYQRWFNAKQQGEIMQYQMQVVVEADNLPQAVSKIQGGEIISVQVKPQPPQPPQRPIPAPQPRPA